MPRKVSRLERTEQPINWWRAFFSGLCAAMLMLAFMDIYNMMGITRFSYEVYLGSLIRDSAYGDANWTIGFLANCLLGGIFGFFYGYFFEYVFKRADTRIGVGLGLGHAVLAAVALFPFFGIIHDEMSVQLYPRGFGFFGSALGPATPLLLLISHLLFGSVMGLFYGPVRADRVRARYSEPGRIVPVGVADAEAITAEEDPEDRVAV